MHQEQEEILITNLESASDFCKQCGNLIDLPEVMDIIECNRCGFKCSVLDYEIKQIISEIKFSKKQWVEQYYNNEQEEMEDENQDDQRATIKSDCPRCNHDTMCFWTKQLRSADEGSTVFYECVKCKFRYQQNN